MADSEAGSETYIELNLKGDKLKPYVHNLAGRRSQDDVLLSATGADHKTSELKSEDSYLTDRRSTYLNLPQSFKSCLNYLSFLRSSLWLYKDMLVRLLAASDVIKRDSSAESQEDMASSVIENLITLGMLDDPIFGRVGVAYPYENLFREAFGRASLPANLNILTHETASLFVYSAIIWWHAEHEYRLPRADMVTICRLKSLVALVLGGKIECLPDEIGDLVHLKFLFLLRIYPPLKDLPRTTGNLQKLQTFFMDNCILDEVPGDICEIQTLRHLEMNSWKGLAEIRVPTGKIEALLNLHSLCGIHLEGGIATELSRLTQLRKLGISKVSDEHVNELFAAITKMTNLISLSLQAESIYYGENKLIIELFPELDAFSPPLMLQEVYLRGHLIDLPSWLLSMENLTKLCLSFSLLQRNTMSNLQFIPNLKYLNLTEASKVKDIGEEFCEVGGFPKLEALYIQSSLLVEWTKIVNGAFPCLRSLTFLRCHKLMFLPDGLQNICTLKKLEVNPIFEDLKRRLQGDENCKIKNIPNVTLQSD